MKHDKYDPSEDHASLECIVRDVVSAPTAIGLITVPHGNGEQAKTIKYLGSKVPHRDNDLVYMEVNALSVGGIGQALQKYSAVPHIILVADVPAVRGVSFRSEDGMRCLTHQYIVEWPCCRHLLDYMCAALIGIYSGKPDGRLYCSKELYERFRKQDGGKDKYLRLAAEAQAARLVLTEKYDEYQARKEVTHGDNSGQD